MKQKAIKISEAVEKKLKGPEDKIVARNEYRRFTLHEDFICL